MKRPIIYVTVQTVGDERLCSVAYRRKLIATDVTFEAARRKVELIMELYDAPVPTFYYDLDNSCFVDFLTDEPIRRAKSIKLSGEVLTKVINYLQECNADTKVIECFTKPQKRGYYRKKKAKGD